jgi:hypothetical protein
MITYSSATTQRLEARARKLGMPWGILACNDNASGKYFAVNSLENGRRVLWSSWVALGWTYNEAVARLEQLSTERV